MALRCSLAGSGERERASETETKGETYRSGVAVLPAAAAVLPAAPPPHGHRLPGLERREPQIPAQHAHILLLEAHRAAVGSASSRRGEAGLRATTARGDRGAVPRPTAPPHLFSEGRVEGEERSREGSGTGTAGGSARRNTERRGREKGWRRRLDWGRQD
jgi:hypothetical protein